MPADGTLFKMCRCRDPNTRKALGSGCPKLRRANRSWNPEHGTWAYQLELPTTADGQRRQLRPIGFSSRAEAVQEMEHARRILDLAAGNRRRLVELGDLVQTARRATGTLPDVETVRRRLSSDSPLTGVPTLAEYLPTWLKDLEVDESTRYGYRSIVRNHLIP